MIDAIINKLEEKRCKLIASWNNYPSDNNKLFQNAIISNDWHFTDSFSTIAQLNIQTAIDFRNMLETSFNNNPNESICLILHGSTAHGLGRIAPNIDHKILFGSMPQMTTRVIPDCRDDVDLILLANHPESLAKHVHDFAKTYSHNGIDLTINLISWNDFWNELKIGGSPAIRRILIFNKPVFLIGQEFYNSIMQTACLNKNWLDIPHELDFRLLMKLADILIADNKTEYFFTTEQLLELFPTFYISGKEGIHIGFPKKRIKITGKR